MRGEEQKLKELHKDRGSIRNLQLQTDALKDKRSFSSGLIVCTLSDQRRVIPLTIIKNKGRRRIQGNYICTHCESVKSQVPVR